MIKTENIWDILTCPRRWVLGWRPKKYTDTRYEKMKQAYLRCFSHVMEKQTVPNFRKIMQILYKGKFNKDLYMSFMTRLSTLIHAIGKTRQTVLGVSVPYYIDFGCEKIQGTVDVIRTAFRDRSVIEVFKIMPVDSDRKNMEFAVDLAACATLGTKPDYAYRAILSFPMLKRPYEICKTAMSGRLDALEAARAAAEVIGNKKAYPVFGMHCLNCSVKNKCGSRYYSKGYEKPDNIKEMLNGLH